MSNKNYVPGLMVKATHMPLKDRTDYAYDHAASEEDRRQILEAGIEQVAQEKRARGTDALEQKIVHPDTEETPDAAA